MATEIKSTLFRFISFRAPELTSDEDLDKRFVLRGEDIAKGIFDDAITNEDQTLSKWQRLKIASSNFTSILSVDELKALNNNLYTFSIWVAKNKYDFKSDDLENEINGITPFSDSDQANLWDNLFYQVVTQKDFYAKEIIIQLLVANNVVKNYNVGDNELSKKLLNARVVLPEELFKKDNESTNLSVSKIAAPTNKTFPVPSADLIKQINVAIAEEANNAFAKLKLEMNDLEKIYIKNYQEAYTLAVANYEKNNKVALDQYNKELEAARVNWCSTRPADQIYDPNDPCHQPALVVKPDIAAFSFSHTSPFDSTFLSDNLSDASYSTLTYLASKKFSKTSSENNRVVIDETLVANFDNFNNFNEIVDDEVTNNNNVIINETETNNTDIVSVGGVLIPIESTPSLNVFEYQLSTSPFLLNRVKASLRFLVPDFSWQISYIEYTLTRTTGDYSDTQVVHKRVGNIIFFPYLNLGDLLIDNESEVESLTATITFTNGCKKSLTINPFNLQDTFQNYLSGDCNDDFSDSDTPAGDEPPFIPYGFGVKQIGVADYNKVEQTIHGYIEGEVAHIENVMAREFKEKSTRRLRRSEITETSSSETEREQLTDTSTADRFEMQNEVSKVIANSKDINVGANVDAHYGMTGENYLNAGAFANYATNTSKEESARQAVTNAKEVTERALDRIVSKVKEERIEKIVEEFEENNSHGFDNRKGDKHVVGVYRWVDKVFKNQIINYGKRLMFEFMIPEPAKLHTLGMESILDKLPLITKPEDPRKATDSLKLEKYSDVTDITLDHWGSKFNVSLDEKKKNVIKISKAFKLDFVDNGQEGNSLNDHVEIPEGYIANRAFLSGSFYHHEPVNAKSLSITVANQSNTFGNSTVNFEQTYNIDTINNINDKVAISCSSYDTFTSNFNIVVECKLKDSFYKKWQQETFNAIIEGYEDALAKYNQQLAEQEAIAVQIKGTNPGFYRQIENTVLRKNCISYLIDQTRTAKNTYGKNNLTTGTSFTDYEVKVQQELDDYASFVKFIEQAFEWNIMSYYFYPFYWGNRDNWTDLYQYDETNDHLFRSFMQSGMARVIVTVRPGFEEAVRYYMQTGLIWNGGEVPVIGDELYLSIVDEMRETVGEKVGKAWPTRVPTSMTILQAQSIGLVVDKALPFDEDLSDFENPEEVPQSTQLDFNDAQIGGANTTGTARLIGKIAGNNGINSKIVLRTITGTTQDITYCDANGLWELNNLPEAKYELFLDANNDFPSDSYTVTVGSKELVVELVNDETVEVNITIESV